MIFRPIRVLVTSILLTLFGFIDMFLYTLMQPQLLGWGDPQRSLTEIHY